MSDKFQFVGQTQTKAGASLKMFPPLVTPVSVAQFPAVSSTRQTPAAPPYSRKKPVSPGPGHGPEPLISTKSN